ncbi:hypothetical protein [Musicola keenii]
MSLLPEQYSSRPRHRRFARGFD